MPFFSLGIVMFEVLTGRAPYLGSNVADLLRRILRADAPRVGLLMPDLDLRYAVAGQELPSDAHRYLTEAGRETPPAWPAAAGRSDDDQRPRRRARWSS
jgi:hypothetical protein